MSKFVAFLNDESGASAAEYVLILALIGIAIVATATTLGGTLNTSLSNAAGKINPPPAS